MVASPQRPENSQGGQPGAADDPKPPTEEAIDSNAHSCQGHRCDHATENYQYADPCEDLPRAMVRYT